MLSIDPFEKQFLVFVALHLLAIHLMTQKSNFL